MFAKSKKVMLIFCSGALVLTAAGCGGNAEPVEPTGKSPAPTATASSSPPTSSPSPTAKPTPTPVPASSKGPAKNWPVPQMPEAAKENSEEGIAAFTKYYFELVDYTVLTYDTKPIKSVTEHSCKLCGEQLIDPADSNAGQGGWQVGGETELRVNFTKLVEGSAFAGFTFHRTKTTIYLAEGEVQGEVPATKTPVAGTLHLVYAPSRKWKVVDIEFIDAGK
ncbi:DUF6318 family protein [Paeniglutamicibacter psychrophenolicus]|uniref:DUF6318 family protein n=1 Tax=Paeniglutamicibacter psychrophenolicus TaxID=257454 RepID=UPI00277E8136|nr:DUF6318 family protein [Paeniglutamicibacter psychrophenolicus]MDQ0095438.1 hypothetical protein [Paeniglutamicibacter psychrophenolicus]